jgi:uncharacterized membrane protein SpoIIM required for sporulation
MDLTRFIHSRRPDWRRLEHILERVEGSGLRSLDEEEAVEFGRLYRRAASDLNQAQTFVSGDATVQYLNDLVARCYLLIYGRRRFDFRSLARHFVWGYPAVFRRYFLHFLLATVIFLGGGVFGFIASFYDPSSRAMLLPADMPTIQPGESAHDVQSTGEFLAFSAFLFRNNMNVSLLAFALGITLGVGSVWLLFYNGVMTGALCAVFVEAGQLLSFATGILPHGVLEIPAAIIGGAAGLVLAQGMIRARPWPRLEEMARAGKEGLFLVSGCFPLLVLAAILEAGVARAPEWFLGSGLKLAVAGVFGILFAAYVFLLGWRRRPAVPGERA